MKIYTYPKSRSLRVLWAMEEIGASYETIEVDLFNQSSGIKSPHPRGKVPFLEDGDFSIEESLAICIYLCEKFNNKTLYPSDPKQKANVNAWLSYALNELEPPVWSLLKQLVFIPENQRQQEVINYSRAEANKIVSKIKLNHEWIAGPNFTLADIFITHILQWAQLCKIDLTQEITDYIKRATLRPAYSIAIDKN